VEVTALLEIALRAIVDQLKIWLILPHGALNIHGIKLAANVWFLIKVQEMLMQLITIQMVQLTLVYGKLTA
jgi:hypothetical protein